MLIWGAHPRSSVGFDWLWYCAMLQVTPRVFRFLWGMLETDFRVWSEWPEVCATGVEHRTVVPLYFTTISCGLIKINVGSLFIPLQ